ncbi:phosphopantetheine-binding protein [Kitasatospora sp. NPDC001603]|uniref:phosphopantetheine-binding protein n=1 Tax=Kitasatospora sp. NPDC001603 TaxID=3154388 RepID=UPI003327F952
MTDTTPSGSAPVLDTESIRADIAELLGEEPAAVGDDDDLRDLGLDSMRLMHLIEKWRARGARVDFADLADLGAPTVRVWSAHLSAA